MNLDEKLVEALGILALKELCAYIDLEGNPVICDYEAYIAQREQEYNKYWMTPEQFNKVKEYLETTFKGKL